MQIVGELYHGIGLTIDNWRENQSHHVTFTLGPIGAYGDMVGYVTHEEFIKALDGKQDKGELTDEDFNEICV